MKKVLVMLFVALSAAAQTSETQYLSNSKLPVELQAKVNQALETRCGKLANPKEESTTVEEGSDNNGEMAWVYTTTLTASWYFDGSHPISTVITVKAADIGSHNPADDQLQVLEVTDTAAACQ